MYFKLPFNITPVKDTLNTVDTLLFEADFSDSLKEELSGQYYRLQNFNFKTKVAFNKLGDTTLGISQQPGATTAFTVTNEVGGITGLSETFGTLSFIYANGTYKLRTKIVAKQKGVFAISFFSQHMDNQTPLDFIDLGETSSGGKRKAYLENIWYLINNGDTNFDLYSKNTKVGNISLPGERNYEVEATYTFVVK